MSLSSHFLNDKPTHGYCVSLTVKFIFVIAALIVLIPFCLNARISTREQLNLLQTEEDRYFLPSERWLVPLSLGYREAAAGLVWTRLLVYYGGQYDHRGDFDYLEAYLDAVTTLDPYFYRAYSWGSTSPIYNGTIITIEDVRASIRILDRGLEYFPDDGRLHYYLGFQYYFELVPFLEGEEQDRARRIGVDEMCTAALLGGAPTSMPLFCSSLAERQGLDFLARERLIQALVNTDDQRTRARIEERLERLISSDDAFYYSRQISQIRQRWLEEMPYAPMGFYAIAGPVPPFPTEDQVELPLLTDTMIDVPDDGSPTLEDEQPSNDDNS